MKEKINAKYKIGSLWKYSDMIFIYLGDDAWIYVSEGPSVFVESLETAAVNYEMISE